MDVDGISLCSQFDEPDQIPALIPGSPYTSNTDLHLKSPTAGNTGSCASAGRLRALHTPVYIRSGAGPAAKLSSRVQRAKALGRQYSSTPVLADPRLFSQASRRVSLDTTDAEVQQVKTKYSPESQSHVGRRVSSAAQLGPTSSPQCKVDLQTEPSRSESTSCCSAHQHTTMKPGSEGLRFWRNNTISLSAACLPNYPELYNADSYQC